MRNIFVIWIIAACASNTCPQLLAQKSASTRWTKVDTFRYRSGEGQGVERIFKLESPEEPEMENGCTRLRVQTPGLGMSAARPWVQKWVVGCAEGRLI